VLYGSLSGCLVHMIGLLACAASRRENVVDLFSIYSCPTTNITAANAIGSIAVAN
jgi:hypothetical protein